MCLIRIKVRIIWPIAYKVYGYKMLNIHQRQPRVFLCIHKAKGHITGKIPSMLLIWVLIMLVWGCVGMLMSNLPSSVYKITSNQILKYNENNNFLPSLTS